MSIFKNPLAYVISYILLMIPTYILPWLGSNSAVINAVGAAASGTGPTPQWWAHFWFLAMLTIMTWVRGGFVGRNYLAVFPFLATVFDLTPGLSLVPFVPTIMHLVAIILGVSKAGDAFSNDAAVPSRWAWKSAALVTMLAIGGTLLFVGGLGRSSGITAHPASTPTLAPHSKSELEAKPSMPSVLPAKAAQTVETTQKRPVEIAAPPQSLAPAVAPEPLAQPVVASSKSSSKDVGKMARHSTVSDAGKKKIAEDKANAGESSEDVEVRYITIH